MRSLGQMDGWMDRWMDGWIDGQWNICKYSRIPLICYLIIQKS